MDDEVETQVIIIDRPTFDPDYACHVPGIARITQSISSLGAFICVVFSHYGWYGVYISSTVTIMCFTASLTLFLMHLFHTIELTRDSVNWFKVELAYSAIMTILIGVSTGFVMYGTFRWRAVMVTWGISSGFLIVTLICLIVSTYKAYREMNPQSQLSYYNEERFLEEKAQEEAFLNENEEKQQPQQQQQKPQQLQEQHDVVNETADEKPPIKIEGEDDDIEEAKNGDPEAAKSKSVAATVKNDLQKQADVKKSVLHDDTHSDSQKNDGKTHANTATPQGKALNVADEHHSPRKADEPRSPNQKKQNQTGSTTGSRRQSNASDSSSEIVENRPRRSSLKGRLSDARKPKSKRDSRHGQSPGSLEGSDAYSPEHKPHAIETML